MNYHQALFRYAISGRYQPQELEKLEKSPIHQNEYGYDLLGLNEDDRKRALWLFRSIYDRYLHIKSSGSENIPAGRVILVANQFGALPLELSAICAAAFFESRVPRIVRVLVGDESAFVQIPFTTSWFKGLGWVRGGFAEAKRLLNEEECLLVFPENSIQSATRICSTRYSLGAFDLGCIRLALETHAPIVPVAFIGHQRFPSILNSNFDRYFDYLWKLLPHHVFMPLLQLAISGSYYLQFGESRCLHGSVNDDRLMREIGDELRYSIQKMIDHQCKHQGEPPK